MPLQMGSTLTLKVVFMEDLLQRFLIPQQGVQFIRSWELVLLMAQLI